MGSKLDSLRFLAEEGFNTPNFHVATNIKELHDLLNSEKLRGEKLSIRTDWPDKNEEHDFGDLPFLPNVEHTEAIIFLIEKVFPLNLIALVQDAIDLNDNLLGGVYIHKISKHPTTLDEEYIEYYEGPGTIRDMHDSKVKKKLLNFPRRGRQSYPPEDTLMYIHLMRSKVKQLIGIDKYVEFSIYPYPIGKKNHPLIFWEIKIA